MADTYRTRILGVETWFDHVSGRWHGTILPKGYPDTGVMIRAGSSRSLDGAIAKTKALIHDMQTGRARDPRQRARDASWPAYELPSSKAADVFQYDLASSGYRTKREGNTVRTQAPKEAVDHAMRTSRHYARDVDVPPPSSRRVPRTPGAYRFAVTTALVRKHHMTDARAGRLVQKWERLVETRREDGRSPSSTAEHVARFEKQHLVSPYPRRDASRKRSKRRHR